MSGKKIASKQNSISGAVNKIIKNKKQREVTKQLWKDGLYDKMAKQVITRNHFIKPNKTENATKLQKTAAKNLKYSSEFTKNVEDTEDKVLRLSTYGKLLPNED